MNRYYAAFLDLTGRSVLVVGGGEVAARKTEAALRGGARITVVAPGAGGRIAALARRKRIAWVRRGFKPSDLRGRELVFCATDDEAVNRRVGRECRKRRIWANVADRPALCGFIVPATARRGDVVFAISTAGASPGLAKFLKKRVERRFGPEVGRLAAALRRARKKLLRVPLRERREILRRALTEKTLVRLRRKRQDLTRLIEVGRQGHGTF